MERQPKPDSISKFSPQTNGNSPSSALENTLLAATECRGIPVRELPKHPKIIAFDDLATCGGEVWIENQGELYRLRRTRQGKLILTK